MFKTWQIFVFSLVPLALVFAGVIGGSMDGKDSSLEVFPTPAPRPASSSAPPPPPPPGGTSLTLVMKTLLFDKRTLSATANGPIVLQLDNQDVGTLHNVAFYTNRNVTTKIFGSELVTGPKVETFTFTAPPPGSYFYRCDVHPDTMTGTLTTR